MGTLLPRTDLETEARAPSAPAHLVRVVDQGALDIAQVAALGQPGRAGERRQQQQDEAAQRSRPQPHRHSAASAPRPPRSSARRPAPRASLGGACAGGGPHWASGTSLGPSEERAPPFPDSFAAIRGAAATRGLGLAGAGVSLCHGNHKAFQAGYALSVGFALCPRLVNVLLRSHPLPQFIGCYSCRLPRLASPPTLVALATAC